MSKEIHCDLLAGNCRPIVSEAEIKSFQEMGPDMVLMGGGPTCEPGQCALCQRPADVARRMVRRDALIKRSVGCLGWNAGEVTYRAEGGRVLLNMNRGVRREEV